MTDYYQQRSKRKLIIHFTSAQDVYSIVFLDDCLLRKTQKTFNECPENVKKTSVVGCERVLYVTHFASCTESELFVFKANGVLTLVQK